MRLRRFSVRSGIKCTALSLAVFLAMIWPYTKVESFTWRSPIVLGAQLEVGVVAGQIDVLLRGWHSRTVDMDERIFLRGLHHPGLNWGFDVQTSPPYSIGVPIWAIVLALLLIALLLERRTFHDWLRRRRNQCVKCGYSLQNIDSNRCPECGFDNRTKI